MKSKRRK